MFSSQKILGNFKGLKFFDTFEFESLHGSHTFPQFEKFSRRGAKARLSGDVAAGLAYLRLRQGAVCGLFSRILPPV
jgi:hypothetical protein